MTSARIFSFVMAIAVSAFAAANGQYQEPVASYYPAFCLSPGGSVGLENLEVFPNRGRAIRIQLPFGLGRFAYSQDGKALYAERMNDLHTGDKHELYRIDLNPIQVSAIPAQASIRPIHSIAVSLHEDRILVSGGYKAEGKEHCGVFEIMKPGGTLRPVLESSDCRYISAWVHLSLSPDGTQAVAVHGRSHSLDLIDVARGEARSFGTGVFKASWSPDGRWIAALEGEGKARTVLFDAHRLSRAKILSESEVEWSPDSRYLLAISSRGCSNESGTIQTLDIQSGARAAVISSKCRVYQPTAGWVSSAVVPGHLTR